MESEQDKGSISRSPRKVMKRAKTWEISDSETEEESTSVQRDDTKATEVPRSNLEGLHGESEAYETSQGGQENLDLKTNSESASMLPVPPSGSTTPSPSKRTRRKKSPEELEADRIRAEERRKEKEAKKQEKERRRNQEKEEKEKRKESALALKLLRPDQCGKYMTVQLDAGLLQDAGCEDLLDSLRSSGYNFSIEPHSVPYSVTWRREMPGDWTCMEGLELCRGEEDEMLILMEPKDFLTSVHCYVQVPVPSSNTEIPGAVFGFCKKNPDKKVTLVILGLRDFLRCQRLSHKMERHSLEAKSTKARDDLKDGWVTWRQIDEALVFLQLYYNMEVLNLDTWKQLGQHVCAVTKSVAQRPFRLMQHVIPNGRNSLSSLICGCHVTLRPRRRVMTRTRILAAHKVMNQPQGRRDGLVQTYRDGSTCS
ncbi:probable crossover junction endonuclease EME2 isoform X2 [Dendropsophus ebraccatus]|uniref:probable crossover junction endonuclease EME2 isoform X2 n=1 Tax=Dendropsophus ebraccatus TaxID=150705 RepID=UPI00383179B1